MPPEIVEADLTWLDGAFRTGIRVATDADGRIARAGPLAETPTRRLTRRALLPGLVDAHSHAFQRGLRGQGERFPAGSGSFWTWREAMYELVDGLDTDGFRRLARQAFTEMRAAGITTVGEFHYLHHSPRGDDFAFDPVVLAAAREAGIRIALLSAYYRTGGIGRPLAGAQRRFATPSPSAYWEALDALGGVLDARTQSLGCVVHSIRAAELDELAALRAEATRRGLVLHMHVEEQRREIEDCLAAYGRRPMAMIVEALDSADHLTAVHCTHTRTDDLEAFLAAGGTVCVCPLTEANLGDGLPQLQPHALSGRLCLGTDSNARIAMLEEMRWLEYGQRLARESRGVLADDAGHVARRLLEAATTVGARSLGVAAGSIAPGRWADFTTVNLDHPTLAHAEPDTLLEAIVFGSGNEAIDGTCVGGEWSRGG